MKKSSHKSHPATAALKTTKQILRLLDRQIVGQYAAKQVLATAAYSHYLLKAYVNSSRKRVDTRHKNLLLVGPSGCGKTHLVRCLAEHLGVPFLYFPVTALTQAGYVGTDVDDICRLLFEQAGCNASRAEQGMVFLDEVDKIACTPNSGLDVSGKGAQTALLPILDGSQLHFTQKGRTHSIDTSRLFIVAAGAFTDLHRPTASTLKGVEPHVQPITTQRLVQFGLLDELLGRFGRVASLDALTCDQLAELLHHDRRVHAIKQHFKLHEVDLEFSDAAANRIAELALERGTGARGLATIVSETVADIEVDLSDLRGRTVTVDTTPAGSLCVTKVTHLRDHIGNLIFANPFSCFAPTQADRLRLTALAPPPTDEFARDADLLRRQNPFSDTREMSDADVEQELSALKPQIGFFDPAHFAARWWARVLPTPRLQLLVARELFYSFRPPATLAAFYAASLKTASDGILPNLYYLKFERSRSTSTASPTSSPQPT